MQQMWPVGDTPEALDVATQRAARILDGLEDVYLHAAIDDDYIGVQTYSRSRVGPEGTLGPEDGVETTIMGYEFWPEALEATIRRAWDVTNQTPDPRHRERHRQRRRHPADRVRRSAP